MAVRNVAVIVLYNEKKEILLQHRLGRSGKTKDQKYWGFFGGKIEDGESPEQALQREIMEELEYKVSGTEPFFVQKFFYGDEKNEESTMCVFLEKYDASQSLVQHEGLGMQWWKLGELDGIPRLDLDKRPLSKICAFLSSVRITYFVHGTTTDNEKEISSGWADPELSELGVQQSLALKNTTKDKRLDVAFCSDLKRAHDSAKLIFEGNVPIMPDRRLRECNYGTYNGKPTRVVGSMKEKHATEKFPDGESYEDVKNRVADFLEFLKTNYAGKLVAIVAHEGPQLALEVLLKGKTWEDAFKENWRNTKSWQPGWDYVVE